MADAREQAIETIAASARAQRGRPPRWLWIVAGGIGLACVVAFIVAVTREPAPSTGPSTRGGVDAGGFGFGAGLVVGGAAGVAIGIAIGRSRSDQARR